MAADAVAKGDAAPESPTEVVPITGRLRPTVDAVTWVEIFVRRILGEPLEEIEVYSGTPKGVVCCTKCCAKRKSRPSSCLHAALHTSCQACKVASDSLLGFWIAFGCWQNLRYLTCRCWGGGRTRRQPTCHSGRSFEGPASGGSYSAHPGAAGRPHRAAEAPGPLPWVHQEATCQGAASLGEVQQWRQPQGGGIRAAGGASAGSRWMFGAHYPAP